jgi:hypothetical protein
MIILLSTGDCFDLQIPKNMRIIFLPPYSPELNPAEHLWEEIREKPGFLQEALMKREWFSDFFAESSDTRLSLGGASAVFHKSLSVFPTFLEKLQ